MTAGKLLHAKRPRLIPIFDRGRVAKVLHPPPSQFWEVMWYALRDPEIRQKLQDLQSSVSESAALSLLRVLDIIVWMSLNRQCQGLATVSDDFFVRSVRRLADIAEYFVSDASMPRVAAQRQMLITIAISDLFQQTHSL